MESAARNAPPPRILVVEDEPDIAALVAYQLTKDGFRVETAASGSDALQAVHRDVPDLIVLDRMLPGMSGDQVLESLKGEESTRQVPVLLLTEIRMFEYVPIRDPVGPSSSPVVVEKYAQAGLLTIE